MSSYAYFVSQHVHTDSRTPSGHVNEPGDTFTVSMSFTLLDLFHEYYVFKITVPD